MKMEQKKVQEKAKREHRRVMMAVDEFLKVEIKMIDWLFFWFFCPSREFSISKGRRQHCGNLWP